MAPCFAQEQFTPQDQKFFYDLEQKIRKQAPKQDFSDLKILNQDLRRQKIFKDYQAQITQDYQAVQGRVSSLLGSNQGQDEFIGNANLSEARFDTLIFASFSLSKDTLQKLYTHASGKKNATIVFRGLPPGCTTINEAIVKIQALAQELKLKNPPNAVINPVWFKQYHVTSVPTITVLKEPTTPRSGDPKTKQESTPQEVLAQVSGLIDLTWLNQQIAQKRLGDFGKMGPVASIIERDLIEEMVDRASKIDWQAKKQQALARVWQNIPIIELTKALKWRKRLIDPSFIVNRDVTLPDGKLLVKKGEVINPLDRRPFDRLLIVFDGQDQGEIAFIKAQLPKWLAEHKLKASQVKLIITGLDRNRGWDAYQSLTNYFDDEVFVLTSEVRDSFVLEHHPCLVYAEDRHFVVEEFAHEI